MLKNRSDTILQSLLKELNFATCFYQILILSLSNMCDSVDEKWSLELSSSPKRLAIYKSLIFLGDIARYRITYQSDIQKDWTESWNWYQKAFELFPYCGKPHGQLAILSTYQSSDIDAVYYNCLSLGNLDSGSLPRVNLNNVIQKILTTEKNTETEYSKFQIFLNNSLSLFGHLFSPNVNGMETLVEFELKLCESILSVSLDECLDTVTKLVISYIILVDDLGNSFENTTQTQKRQSIRNLQVIALAYLYSLVQQCITSVLDSVPDGQFQLDAVSIEKLLPISIFCSWQSFNVDIIQHYLSYGTLLKPKEFETRLHEWAKSITALANLISSFADMDEDITYTAQDRQLIALNAFDPLFKSLKLVGLPKHLVTLTDETIIHYGRILSLAKRLADNEKINFVVLNNGLFSVRDNHAKRKDLQRLMKAMASERLKDEIITLETQLGGFQHLDVMVYVLDTDCMIFRLNTVKSWLMSRKCVLVIPLDVIQSLDRLKKGTEKINTQARDAIRYLEDRFKFPSPYLIGQKPEETKEVWNPDGSYAGQYIPRNYQSILGCLLYFQKISNEREAGGFAFVTDNQELCDITKELNIDTIDVYNWNPPKSRKFRD
ncbi:hypothetical protein HDV02_000036 [Globomyces sp. JEL0801]|nr:hypothetical protein HDV02_000036 [Globomyces sp. JEL0801]